VRRGNERQNDRDGFAKHKTVGLKRNWRADCVDTASRPYFTITLQRLHYPELGIAEIIHEPGRCKFWAAGVRFRTSAPGCHALGSTIRNSAPPSGDELICPHEWNQFLSPG
jgi:hypothetical protein